jgi:hypothetical protein
MVADGDVFAIKRQDVIVVVVGSRAGIQLTDAA